MKLEFNEQQLNILSAAIVELPYRISAPLINHINQQIKEQQMLEFDERRDKSVDHQNV
jgi:16S rRNA A1518/A1519 N6-dimethyltransferase RsmA/KsgA/DIM1 with predicted DNA glycosylase/AP lyase activity